MPASIHVRWQRQSTIGNANRSFGNCTNKVVSWWARWVPNKKIIFSNSLIFTLSKSHGNRIAALFGRSSPNSKEQLLQKLHKLVGPFVGSLDTRSYQSTEERICIDSCKCKDSYHRYKQYPIDQLDLSTATLNEDNANSPRNIRKEYSKDQMLRDLFLWAVFMNMPEMAKVLLVHVQSRLCAALIASPIFKQYAKLADTIDLKEILRSQAMDFGTFAGNFIDRCYEYNEKTACELLFRQLPLFGYVTCMQVISKIVAYSKVVEH